MTTDAEGTMPAEGPIERVSYPQSETPDSPLEVSAVDEIAAAVANDETRLGDVYRLTESGSDAMAIAEALGVPTQGFVYSYRVMAEALIHGTVPTSPVLASQIAGRVRKWLKTKEWSDAARDQLSTTERRLEAFADSTDTRAEETRQASEATVRQESSGTPGVYVYTYPHYLRHPYEPDSGRTLLKIGQSETDAAERAVNQVKGAFVPEDPWLLRVYTSSDPRRLESTMHRLLDAADHERSGGKRAGREWFVTSTKYLDEVASLAGAVVHFANEFEVLAD